MIIWGHGRRRATVGVSWPGRGDAIRERSAQSARSPSCATRNAPAGVAVPGRPPVDRWIKLRELAHPTPRLSIGGCDEIHRHVELARTRISAVPSRPRGVVVPRLERAATVVANTVRGPVVFVQRIAPADVDPAQSTQTHVVPRETCEEAGWKGTVGMIHSHPGGDRCFYYFPGTQVPSSDAESFARQPYPVDAIMCGDSIVWISRDKTQRQVRLAAGPIPMAADQRPGNRVHTGSLLAARGE